MHTRFTQLAGQAVGRYVTFTELLRGQADMALRRGPVNEKVRQETNSVAREAARSYASLEHAYLNDHTADIARAAHDQAIEDLGLKPRDMPDRLAEFIFSAAAYTAQLIAAQAERDTVAVAHQVRSDALRVDLYARSGRHTETSAIAAVVLDSGQGPSFRFVDRLGRRFKSTKHIRDTYRHHLLSVYNEVYLDTVADHGHDTVRVTHPDTNYKWNGDTLALVGDQGDFPLYYDVRDEIFHPSSNAILTILQEG